MQQSKIDSFMEQLCNNGSGMILAFAVWEWVIRPLIHADYMTIDSTLAITTVFTCVSLVRGYCWRRLFNKGSMWCSIKARWLRV